ncbi:MAG: hypothetical protein Q8M19_09375 [Reyranella sp.]|nr:hypothetical protein [Reyranella sp.]
MSNVLFRIVGASALVLGVASIAAAPSFAKDRTNLNVKRTHALDRATGGDRAQSRMSERGLANSNGLFMSGRATGRDRADDRMNPHGLGRGNVASADRDVKQADRRATKHAERGVKYTDRPVTYAAGSGRAGKGQNQ